MASKRTEIDPDDDLAVPRGRTRAVKHRAYMQAMDAAAYDRVRAEVSKRGFNGVAVDAFGRLCNIPRSAITSVLAEVAAEDAETLYQSDFKTRCRHARALERMAAKCVDLAGTCRGEPSLTELKLVRSAVSLLREARELTGFPDDPLSPSADCDTTGPASAE